MDSMVWCQVGVGCTIVCIGRGGLIVLHWFVSILMGEQGLGSAGPSSGGWGGLCIGMSSSGVVLGEASVMHGGNVAHSTKSVVCPLYNQCVVWMVVRSMADWLVGWLLLLCCVAS